MGSEASFTACLDSDSTTETHSPTPLLLALQPSSFHWCREHFHVEVGAGRTVVLAWIVRLDLDIDLRCLLTCLALPCMSTREISDFRLRTRECERETTGMATKHAEQSDLDP